MTIVTPNSTTPSSDPVDHLCQNPGCEHWGAWGYDGGQGVTGWWCLEHRPDQDPVKPAVTQDWVSDGNEG